MFTHASTLGAMAASVPGFAYEPAHEPEPATVPPPTPVQTPIKTPSYPRPERAQAPEHAQVLESTIESETGLFETRQKQYLIGRTATKTILNNKGNVIIEAGEKITASVVDSAKVAGKMVQLVLNNRA